jgi:hypothetical protein
VSDGVNRSEVASPFSKASPRAARIAVGIAAGAGALLMLVRAGASESKPVRFLHEPHLGLEQNKQPLAARELATLTQWAGRYRSCAAAAGVRLEEPVIAVNEVVMSVPRGTRLRVRDLARCDRLGEPPLRTSLVFAHDGRLHLFRPRTCALPPRRGP